MTQPLLECVPNFSEGRDESVIRQITDEIRAVDGAELLDVDPGKATNRTVVTFVGEPDAVVEAAFRAIRKAAELIDMSRHHGEHPRMGATDVCPFVPVANVTMAEAVECARRLGERVGRELGIPVYLYEEAASRPERRNLAAIREGEYEALPDKLPRPEWKPDFGQAEFKPRSGATVIGARDFLVAYNVNLNSTSTRWANAVACDVREKGRRRRENDDPAGAILTDDSGQPIWEPGTCKAVKGLGWFIEEYGIAQVSLNLTNLGVSPIHKVFDEVCRAAEARGLRVTGSELIGLVPLNALLDAGRHYLRQQRRSLGVPESELVKIAVKSLGLDDLAPFDPDQKIIEYRLRDASRDPLVRLDLRRFAEQTASESPAPGGGSVAAYLGALAASLGTMVANLSAHKRGWEDRWDGFFAHAEEGQRIQAELLRLVDEDTHAFNRVLDAIRLPKGTEEEQAARRAAIEKANKGAIEVPFRVMELALEAMAVVRAVAETGLPSSVSDAGVGALCARSALMGAFLNVRINCGDVEDRAFVDEKVRAGQAMLEKVQRLEAEVLDLVEAKIQT